jgi:aromatic ring hydroxylase
MWYKAEEHIKHIVAGCTTIAPSEYNYRHNKVAGYIHWMICKHMGLQVTDK